VPRGPPLNAGVRRHVLEAGWSGDERTASIVRDSGRSLRLRSSKTVLLVGTRHDYQIPGNPGSDQFRVLVSAICQERNIRLLAEEMNLDALSQVGATISICKQVADSLAIEHRYCDPSIEEQKALGIANPGKVSAGAFSPTCDYYEPDPEVREANAIRERRWLEHVIELDLWPALFVCGAHHTESFQNLLQTRLITVHVLFPRCGWAPGLALLAPGR